MAEERKELIKLESGEAEQPFRWSAGVYGSRFLTELRDNKRFVGVRCPKCGKVYVPPRNVCGPCFVELTELVPVSDEGEIITFTVVSFGFVDPSTGKQKPVPYGYAVIKLDGADTYILHYLDETDPQKIKVGARVKAVFEEERTGSMLDVKHFTLLDR
ncbi:Zn-ribbon domain-containing OB-fold protein [Candidatus Solincola tengchongensis]|uniref:Zn-ribbon domain-containing OB-fold protein n=1 Tax=Candidatus Solincola tengchongensis TaxID=2900693 RepID=UPI00257EC55A|nr:Zn-ribbon domain-containing OB-fold protein [Candidatus Solincola tengchongensis]